MAMQTVYFKEHEGIVNNHNPSGQLPAMQAMPWWSPFSPQPAYGDSLGSFKSTEHSIAGDLLTAAKQAAQQEQSKGTATQFTIFPGDSKHSVEGQKPHPAFSVQPAPSEYRARFELGFGQPMVCTKLPCADQYYGIFSAYGSQVPGRVMLPLNLTSDDGPIYVNAKQYHGIMRRRQSRAKAEMANKAARLRKPYMHESRHLHAMRRPRGCGGRFLNTKATNNGISKNEAKKVVDGLFTQPTGSQSSEVLQSDSGTLNSSKGANGSRSNHSGSEVTSMYSRGDMGRHFHKNPIGQSGHSLSDMIIGGGGGHGMVMPASWVAADNCCNLKV